MKTLLFLFGRSQEKPAWEIELCEQEIGRFLADPTLHAVRRTVKEWSGASRKTVFHSTLHTRSNTCDEKLCRINHALRK
jgi:hypothetical protein